MNAKTFQLLSHFKAFLLIHAFLEAIVHVHLDHHGQVFARRTHHFLDDKTKGKARNLARWIDTEILDFREKGQRVILGTLLEYMNWKYEMDGKLKVEVKEAYRYHKKCIAYYVNGYRVCKTAYDYACWLNSRKHLEDVVGWQRECRKVEMEGRNNQTQKEVA